MMIEYVVWQVGEYGDYWCCQKNVDSKPVESNNGYATPEEALAAMRRWEDDRAA